MKKIISVIISICCLLTIIPSGAFSITVGASSGNTDGDISWSLDGTVLTISGNGNMPDYSAHWGDNCAPWGTDITEVIINEGVKSIGNHAFYRCEGLEKVTIPKSVTIIGDWAFFFCTNLKNVVLPEKLTTIGENAFDDCHLITDIDIPDNVTSIGRDAFFGCDLKKVEIPKSVTYIGPSAFSACDNLTIMVVDEENPIYHSSGNCIIETKSKTLVSGCKNSIIPSDGSVTIIGDSAFRYCRDAQKIIIPDGITAIGDSAFSDCYSLKSMVFPDSVKTLGTNVFSLCGAITNITLPEGVTSIGYNTFDRCNSLESLIIPKSVISLDNVAISSCVNLESLKVADGNSVYHSARNCIIETESKTLVAGCKTSIIPDDGSVISIGDNAFHYCATLTAISIPEGVTTIGSYAFRYCTGLENIMLPNTLKTIDFYAFDQCPRLKKIGLPKSITVIEQSAFENSVQDVWYAGGEADREAIEIDINNGLLTSATWHYNACSVHSYLYSCDEICDVCGFTRIATAKHTYENEDDLICNVCDEIVEFDWSLNGTVLTIRGVGDIPDYDEPWSAIPHEAPWGTDITEVIIKDGIKSIGDNAFWGCNQLGVIFIPESVTSIGDIGFYNGCIIASKDSYAQTYANENDLAFIDQNDYSKTISSIEIEDVSIMEYSNGYYDNNKFYYHSPILCGTVTYKDGSTKKIYGSLEIDNRWYNINTNIHELQNEQPLAVGTYEVTGTLLGVRDTFNLSITETPIEGIEINDVSIIEYSNGYYDNDKFYYHSPILCGTVTYKDGTTGSFSCAVEIDDEWYSVDTNIWDIQNEKSLTVGTYEVTGTVLGVSDTFNLTITETPIESIDIKDITLYDGIHNYGGEYYFNPVFDVVLKNGDVYKDNVNGFSLNGTHFSVNCTYDQENWEVGNIYCLSGKVAGFSDTFNVTIKETPVKSVEFTKMPRTEYITGENFDIRGAELRINYNDGKYEDIIINDCIYYTNTLLIKCEYFDLSFECFFEQYFSEVGKQTVEFDVLGKKLKVDVNVSKNLAESAKLKVDNDELVITITNSDGSSYDLKIVGNCISGGGVDNMVGWFYAENMIFEAMVHFVYDEDTKTYSNVSFELINFVDEVLKTNEVEVCEWLKIYDKASNIYWGITFSRDFELISYLGEITKENIDVIMSTAAYLEYGHYMAEYELDDGKYYGKFTADEIRTAVYKHFDIDYIDVSISDKYDSKNDVVYVSDMDGGGPERTTVTKYDNYWYLELISFDFVKYYILCDEEGKIIAFDTKELYEPEFGYITDSGEYENIYWQYFEETKTLKISGKGEIPDFTTSYLAQPWYLYKNKIEKLVIDGEFTSIGNNAFSKLTALSTVIMPDKIRFIKKGAFADCVNLLEIVLPNDIKEIFENAFEGCKKLSSVKGLEYVLSIGEQAFAGCDLKGTISLNRALYVDSNAFDGCDDIKAIKYGPDTYTDISSKVLGDHNPLIYVTYGSPIIYDVIFDNKTFFLIGDLNSDGLLNACDIIRLRRCLLDETVADKYISDINLDGETDVRDLVKIKKIIANIF